MAVTDYSTTAADNTSISGITVTDATVANQIDNIIRQMMADIATEFQREYHDATISGGLSWRINGTTLECWGRTASMTGGAISISFPKTFARAPTVTATPYLASAPGATEVYAATVDTITTTSAVARGRYHSGGTETVSNVPVCWHATGEWDGVS